MGKEDEMKILVFGASGGTGRELVTQALEQGHVVTAFLRDPVKMNDIQHANLSLVSGDVLDPLAVANAVQGQEAVLVTIGAGPKRTTIREEGTRNVVNAMQDSGVKRLLCMSSLGVGDSRSNLPFFTRYVVVGMFLRHAFADHENQEIVVMNSTLDWTLVRPPHLKDGPHTGTYQHGFTVETTYRDIEGWISRSDVADFMLKQLTDDTYVHDTPGVSY